MVHRGRARRRCRQRRRRSRRWRRLSQSALAIMWKTSGHFLKTVPFANWERQRRLPTWLALRHKGRRIPRRALFLRFSSASPPVPLGPCVRRSFCDSSESVSIRGSVEALVAPPDEDAVGAAIHRHSRQRTSRQRGRRRRKPASYAVFGRERPDLDACRVARRGLPAIPPAQAHTLAKR